MNFGNRLMTVSPHLLDWASNTSAGPRANQASSILMFPDIFSRSANCEMPCKASVKPR